MGALQEMRRIMSEEKTRFEQALEDMGFEEIKIIRVSSNSYSSSDKNGKGNGKSNGKDSKSISGFAQNNELIPGWYTRTFIKDPEDFYSREPKICLELQINDSVGAMMTIHSIPWMKHYYYNAPGHINRKEALKLLNEYFSK